MAQSSNPMEQSYLRIKAREKQEEVPTTLDSYFVKNKADVDKIHH
jgi:hypothetical protein